MGDLLVLGSRTGWLASCYGWLSSGTGSAQNIIRIRKGTALLTATHMYFEGYPHSPSFNTKDVRMHLEGRTSVWGFAACPRVVVQAGLRLWGFVHNIYGERPPERHELAMGGSVVWRILVQDHKPARVDKELHLNMDLGVSINK